MCCSASRMAAWIACLVFCLLAPSLSYAKCGERSARVKRVIGGQEAAKDSWPWMLSLRVFGIHVCGATLIKEDWAITAAYCINKDKANLGLYYVKAGAHKRFSIRPEGERATVVKIFVHPGAGKGRLHDIALLKLEKPFKLSPAKINTACLPSKGYMTTGDTCYVTGWGKTSDGFIQNPFQGLKEARASPVHFKQCSKVMGKDYYYRTMICAGGQGGTGCEGDHGGPLVCYRNGRWELQGVISWGVCSTDSYTVSSRVSAYSRWMNSVMGTVQPTMLPTTRPNWKPIMPTKKPIMSTKKPSIMSTKKPTIMSTKKPIRPTTEREPTAYPTFPPETCNNGLNTNCSFFKSHCSWHPTIRIICKETCGLC